MNDHFAMQRLATLKLQEPDVGLYLYESCRCAVAHASTQPLVNPDNADDLTRLYADRYLIRDLARHCIEYELGVKSARTIRREHVYQTAGFEQAFPPGLAGSIAAGISIPLSAFVLPNVDARARHEPQGVSLSNMSVQPESLDLAKGILWLRLRSTIPTDALVLKLGVDFKTKTLIFDPVTDIGVQDPKEALGAQALIDSLELQKAMLVNGMLEVYQTGTPSRLGRTESYLPNNLDVQASIANIDNKVTALKTKFNI